MHFNIVVQYTIIDTSMLIRVPYECDWDCVAWGHCVLRLPQHLSECLWPTGVVKDHWGSKWDQVVEEIQGRLVPGKPAFLQVTNIVNFTPFWSKELFIVRVFFTFSLFLPNLMVKWGLTRFDWIKLTQLLIRQNTQNFAQRSYKSVKLLETISFEERYHKIHYLMEILSWEYKLLLRKIYMDC